MVIVAQAVNSLTIDAGGVKVDLLRHGYPVLRVPEMVDGVRLLSLPDVSAMKLNAIANRGAKKDFFDLARLLDEFSLEEMIGFFTRKYRRTDPFVVIRSLAWFDDAEAEPDPVSLAGLTWKEVKAKTREAVAGL